MPYRGPSYLALRYAAMRKTRPFTLSELMHVLGHKFDKPYMAGRSLDRLSAQGLIERTADTWQITDDGLIYLRDTATAYKGEFK